MWLDIAQYKPLKGSSYIPLPDVLKHKKAIINVKNDDDNCLRYALRSALFPASKNSDKLSSYPKEDGLNFDGIEIPTPVSQISKVERLNTYVTKVLLLLLVPKGEGVPRDPSVENHFATGILQ